MAATVREDAELEEIALVRVGQKISADAPVDAHHLLHAGMHLAASAASAGRVLARKVADGASRAMEPLQGHALARSHAAEHTAARKASAHFAIENPMHTAGKEGEFAPARPLTGLDEAAVNQLTVSEERDGGIVPNDRASLSAMRLSGFL